MELTKTEEEKGFRLYKKLPLVVKAKQMDKPFRVKTLEGTMEGKKGDYLVIGIVNEKYPCKKEAFEKTFTDGTEKLDISDIFIRILANLPVTPKWVRKDFRKEWKILERRLKESGVDIVERKV